MSERYDPKSFKWEIRNAYFGEAYLLLDRITPTILLPENHSLKQISIYVDKGLIISPATGARGPIVVENSIESFIEHILKMSEIDVHFEEWANILNEYMFHKQVEEELGE